VVANDPAEFGGFQKREISRWRQVVQTGGISAD
jgi:hypothetical protein